MVKRDESDAMPAGQPAGGSRLLAVLCVLGSILSLQVGSGYATTLFDEAGAAGVTAMRLGLSALLLLIAFRPRLRSWTGEQWRAVVVFGLTLASMNGFFYAAIAQIPFGIAITIEFLGPLGLAAALSRRARDAVWVGSAFAGVAFIGLHNADTGQLTVAGVGYALLAALSWASYILAGARVARVMPGHAGLAGGMTIAALIVIPLGFWHAGTALLNPALLASGLLVAVLSSAIPYGLEISALKTLPKKTFSILVALEPAAGVATGAIMLGQRLDALTIAAIALVVVAGIGATAERREPRRSAGPGDVVLAP